LKSKGKELYDKLKYEIKSGWEKVNENERNKILYFSEGYKEFLDNAKTERESINETIKLARENGFVSLDEIIKNKNKISKGDKFYFVNRGKGIVLFVVGSEDISQGINIVGAHVDVPRLDIKQNPVKEESGVVILKTHYYGGIKKYQWTAIPLAIHGVIIKTDGSKINVVIGENDDDPVFCVTDLLPHLAKDQMDKKMTEGISGENLNILFGNMPYVDKEVKEKIKLNVLSILNSKYGILEEDFISAELEAVPAFQSRDVGIDRSMVGAYGHDDRVCAYTGLRAIFDVKNPKKTCACLLVDKEEVGSMGNTGMQSRFFENVLAKVCSNVENFKYSDLILRQVLMNSRCLSADVSAAVDVNYPDVHEKQNAPYINNGLVITKYTGARGKAGSSDANAEFISYIRNIFNENNVVWQIGELGKVDQGGGGTIAQFVANMDIEVLDCGVPLLSMHAPFEIAGKLDIYMAYKGYLAFYNF
jgi:aspartyl aminopeptidase